MGAIGLYSGIAYRLICLQGIYKNFNRVHFHEGDFAGGGFCSISETSCHNRLATARIAAVFDRLVVFARWSPSTPAV